MSSKRELTEAINESLNEYLDNIEVEWAKKARRLPHMDDNVVHPELGVHAPLYVVIQNLNDEYHWSRDKIADWLDGLHERGAVDLSFTTKENNT